MLGLNPEGPGFLKLTQMLMNIWNCIRVCNVHLPLDQHISGESLGHNLYYDLRRVNQ
jgi:hypothetical protein